MPVQYSSIMEEHQAVRNNVGVFDISHMGELVASGARAGEWLNTMLTNNVAKLEVGAGQYTFLLNDDAGIIDDLIVYRIETGEISAGRECVADRGRFCLAADRIVARTDVQLENQSDRLRRARHPGTTGRRTFPARFSATARRIARAESDRAFRSRRDATSGSRAPATRARTGLRFSSPRKDAPRVWNEILEKGKVVRHPSLRARRARHFAPRDVLSAQWLRSFAGAQSARSRARLFRRSDETEFHRPREAAARKGGWPQRAGWSLSG